MKLLEHWLPPDGAGDPVACLATTFTFDADFFTGDCLARFLRLSAAYQEGDHTADIALLLEEEERLSEARVVVVADRNCGPGARNLRWDLLPATVPGALLHAKVSLLIWQQAMRLVIGSANLTAAGYRRQLEACVVFDVEPGAATPTAFLTDAIAELRDIVDAHTFGDATSPGPKRRAFEILDVAGTRLVEWTARAPRASNVRIALAPGRSGLNPLDRLPDVWRGGPPRRVLALSPFWDEAPGLPGATAVIDRLARRSGPGGPTLATFVVAVEPVPGGGVVRAPANLAEVVPRRIVSEVRAVRKEADDLRRLHAKAVLYEGDDCLAVMIGSSNLTAKGLGLDARSHREINVWFACAPGSRDAARLAELVPAGDEIDPSFTWDPTTDDEELTVEPLPDGFLDALLTGTGTSPTLQLTLDGSRLPPAWSVATPAGITLLDHDSWVAAGRNRTTTAGIADEASPSALDVRWLGSGGEASGTWPVNIADPALLPPPAELRGLPVSVLLAVLASTRPLRQAFEDEYRRHTAARHRDGDELDPLKRFDSSGQLFHRVRRASAALWGLEQRLARPLGSLEALEWRLGGSIGPVAIAEGLCAGVASDQVPRAEARFLLAELVLTLAGVDWQRVSSGVDPAAVRMRVEETLTALRSLSRGLETTDGAGGIDGLTDYVRHAFKQARLP